MKTISSRFIIAKLKILKPNKSERIKQKNTLCRMSFVGTEGLEPTTFAQHPSMGQDVNQGVSGLN